MNLLHLKYAVEIAETGSINKAAEKLFVGQPNLSRSLKELENSIGATLFDRSSRGMILTPEGETFIRYAKTILKQVDELENVFINNRAERKKKFSISVPRASYISHAFSKFSKALIDEKSLEIFYKETNSMRAIKNILQEDYKLGIIRYAENFDKYYKSMLDDKQITYELITKLRYVIVVNKNSELATKENITFDDLTNYIEIAHADPYVPSLPFSEVKKEELPDNIKRRIFVFERGSQFELLAENINTFMWVSPIPNDLLERYGLVQRVCEENKRVYKDVLIHHKDYKLSELDNLFINELCESKRQVFSDGEGIV